MLQLLHCWIAWNKQRSLFCQLYLVLRPNHQICSEAWDPLRKDRLSVCEAWRGWEKPLPTPKTAKTTHICKCRERASALRVLFILDLSTQWRSGTQVPLWCSIWSGAGFWLSLKWQEGEEKMNSFFCMLCLLAAIQCFMSGVLYTGCYKELLCVFFMSKKDFL